METIRVGSDADTRVSGSYPTYEEWKLLFSNNCDIVSNMFLSYL